MIIESNQWTNSFGRSGAWARLAFDEDTVLIASVDEDGSTRVQALLELRAQLVDATIAIDAEIQRLEMKP